MTGLARAHGFGNAAAIVPTMNRDESESVTVRAAVGRLWSVGVPVDVAAVSGGTGRPVRAPGYRFDRRHLWIEPADTESATTTAFDDPLQIPLWRQLPPAGTVTAPSGVWVIVGTGPVAEALRRRFTQLEVTVVEPDGSPTEVNGVVTIAGGGEHGDEAMDVVASFAETAAHLVPSLIDGALWMSVTFNGTATAHGDIVDPVAAAVRALPRVLGQECPGLLWAATDLDIDIAVDPQG